jgi:hypothetical protein
MVDVEVMDEDRFEAMLAAYGADAARWPEAERVLALRYLAATPSGHGLRAEAKVLDALLDRWRLDPPAADLERQVAASAPLARIFRPRTLWLSAAGLAAACVVGVLVGADVGRTSLHAQPTSEQSDPAVTAALDGASEFTPNLDVGSS